MDEWIISKEHTHTDIIKDWKIQKTKHSWYPPSPLFIGRGGQKILKLCMLYAIDYLKLGFIRGGKRFLFRKGGQLKK